jgi:hypothetical protein
MRCADFYEKWKKDPNWCEKSPEAVRQIDHYLELVAQIEVEGVELAAIYKRFPERAAREVLKIKDEELKRTVLHNAAGMIKRGEKVSKSDILVWSGIEKPSPEKPRNPTMVGSQRTVPDVKPAPARCMYLLKDGSGCTAPDTVLQLCTEEKRNEKNCPLDIPDPVEVPEPRRLSDTLTGKENNTRSVLPTSGYPTPATRYTVEANRHDVVTIQNMIKYGDANDEEEAVQTIFEDGVALWLDKIERHIEEEAARGEEEECSA